MMLSTIGRCAALQLLLTLGTSPPPAAAADQSFRGSSRQQTIDDGCTSFTAKSSCIAGTGDCIWLPRNGCVSATATATATARTIQRVSPPGEEGVKAGDDVARVIASRDLQKATPPPTTKKPTAPTQSPTTRSPTNKPTTRSPTKKPTSNPSTSKPTSSKPTTLTPTSKPTTLTPTFKPTTLTPTFKPTTLTPTPQPTTLTPTSTPTTLMPSVKPTATVLTCPQQHCANDVVTTFPVVNSTAICPGLAATTLATFVYNNVVLIELTGPSDPVNAADMVITAPHGGSLVPTYIPDRQTTGPFCPEGCKTDKDSGTLEISRLLQSKFIANYCKVPYLVINHLHRRKLDANREVLEAAQNNTIAMDAWFNFHNFTNVAQSALKSRFGTVDVTNAITNATIKGVNALLFDMHGYAGLDWVPTNGSPLVQWGYRLPVLNLNDFCPIDASSSGTIGSLTHARWMPGHSYECLVRGPGSLASRVTALVDAAGGLTTNALCGHGTPSYEFESPWALANDPNYCADMNSTTPANCFYYSGGYDLEVHERMNWQTIPLSGDHFNAVQAELPRCIRFGGDAVMEAFANVLSVAVMSFMRDLYGNTYSTIG